MKIINNKKFDKNNILNKYLNKKRIFCNNNNFLKIHDKINIKPKSYCNQFCGTNYKPLFLEKNNKIRIKNYILSNGLYCVSEDNRNDDKKNINNKSLAQILDEFNNVKCCKNLNQFITYSEERKNRLYDYKLNKEFDPKKMKYEHFHEKLRNDELRYRCKCNAELMDGKKSIDSDLFPYLCGIDYCKGEINVKGHFDILRKECACRDSHNETVYDRKTNCTKLYNRWIKILKKPYNKEKKVIDFQILSNLPFEKENGNFNELYNIIANINNINTNKYITTMMKIYLK